MTLKALTTGNTQHKLFWTLSILTLSLLALYMILIQTTIYNVVVEKKLSNESREITRSLLAMEEEYMERASNIGRDSLSSYNLELVAKNDVHYVKAGTDSSLSLLRNAE